MESYDNVDFENDKKFLLEIKKRMMRNTDKLHNYNALLSMFERESKGFIEKHGEEAYQKTVHGYHLLH